MDEYKERIKILEELEELKLAESKRFNKKRIELTQEDALIKEREASLEGVELALKKWQKTNELYFDIKLGKKIGFPQCLIPDLLIKLLNKRREDVYKKLSEEYNEKWGKGRKSKD